jgi:hypothetical protein
LILQLGCGSGDGTPNGPPAGGGRAPTAAWIAPTLGLAALPGDTLRVTLRTDDDGPATVTVLADPDRDLVTEQDQVELYRGVDGDGVPQEVALLLPPTLPLGRYAVLLRVDDGANPPAEALLPRPLLVHPAIAGVDPPRSNRYGVVGDVVVFSRGEAEDAAGPLNGDGDALDGVYVAYDAATATLVQPSPSVSMDVAGAGTPPGRARVLPNADGVLSWLTLEADEGANRNAANVQNPVLPFGGRDADLLDVLVSAVVPGVSLTPFTNTYAGATSIVAREGGRILARFAEAFEGAGGTDLDADGDSLDAVFGYVDALAPGPPYEFNQLVLFTVPAAASGGPLFRLAGTGFSAFLTSEVGSAAGVDLNADGDGLDTFLHLGDLATAGGAGAPGTFLALAGFGPGAPPTPVDPLAAFDVSGDRRAGYYVDEAAMNAGGLVGVDVNGDGILGFVPAFYDQNALLQVIPPGTAGALNAPAGSPTMVYDGTRLFFTAQEAPRVDPAPGTNGDGDGGADLAILYWTDHTQPAPAAAPVPVNLGAGVTLQALSLDGTSRLARIAPGWLALVVDEAANGNQDVNGSGAVDLAWLLVDVGVGRAPAVYNPRVVPSAAGTIPLEGVAGPAPGPDAGLVVLRLDEAQNGDLDGDGLATKVFLALVSTDAPTQIRLLDAGGDHVALAGGRVAITAREPYTGSDHDGNGSTRDTVLRVYDRDGALLESGRPCSRLSVPASQTGELWAYLRDEATEGRDLNGDGDLTDSVLGLWIP